MFTNQVLIQVSAHEYVSVSARWVRMQMSIHMFEWVHMSTCEYVSACEFEWVHMGACEYTWVQVSASKCTWEQVSACVYSLVHMSTYKYTYIHKSTSMYTWVHASASEGTWVSAGGCIWGQGECECTQFMIALEVISKEILLCSTVWRYQYIKNPKNPKRCNLAPSLLRVGNATRLYSYVRKKWWCFRPLLCTLFRLNWDKQTPGMSRN